MAAFYIVHKDQLSEYQHAVLSLVMNRFVSVNIFLIFFRCLHLTGYVCIFRCWIPAAKFGDTPACLTISSLTIARLLVYLND